MTSTVSSNGCGNEIPQDGSHTENLLDTLLSFQQRSLFCDTVMLTSNGGTVFAHSAVLAAVCPGLLTSLNQKPFMLHQPNIIDFAQYDSPLIEKLVVFFYTGRLCPVEAGLLIEILDSLGVAFKVIDMNTEVTFTADVVSNKATFTTNDVKTEVTFAADDVNNKGTFTTSEVSQDTVDVNAEAPFTASDEVVTYSEVTFTSDQVIANTTEIKRELDSENVDFNDYNSVIQTDKLNGSIRTKRKYTKRKKTTGEQLIDSEFYAKVTKLCDANKRQEAMDEDSVLLDVNILEAFEEDDDGFTEVDSSVLRDVADRDALYSCSMCDASFAHQNALNRHKFAHYRTEDGLFWCNVCPKVVKLKDTLTRHLRWHEETNAGVVRPTKRLGDSVDSVKSKPHECPICSHRFVTPSRLKAHLNTHSGARPYMCDQCGNRYNDRNELTKHKRRHRGDQRYACDVCGRLFYTSKLRNIHVKTHTGEKPYQCSECGARFTQMPSLKCHMLVHTGELPYHCHMCAKSFRRPTRLKLHILNAHTVHSKRPFVCDLCGRGFSLRGYLAQHKQTHDGTKRAKKQKSSDGGNRDGNGAGVITVDCVDPLRTQYIISANDDKVEDVVDDDDDDGDDNRLY